MLSEDLSKIILSASTEIEQTGTLPDDLLQVAYEEQLFKLFLPKELGGRALSLPDAAHVFKDTSFNDGSFGWLTTIGSGGNLFLENMTETQAKELYLPANAVIAGSGYATGEAHAEKNGYRVSGKWRFCSGAPYASMFTANTIIWRDGEETDEMRACIFMPDQVKIVEDWNAMGLKGTGSHTIRVKDAFIPHNRTFSVIETQNTLGLPVHSFPFVQFSQVSFAAVCLGLGARFLEEAHKLIEPAKSRWDAEKIAGTVRLLKEQQERFNLAEQLFHNAVERRWDMHLNGSLDDHELDQLSAVCMESSDIATDCAVQLFRRLGMQAVLETSPVNRAFRDLWTAGQHGFLNRS
ncbi:Flavin-dependent monooxygenase, oxygenase subunit HsaA [Lysinibacillus sphaericus]|nr:Flavin-dependent monooxygenase, oxygenase subunit HsaA [Lysinibacillus sphaericus]